ncbi:chaperone protein ClpC, chloroplastic-like [Populus trichocarpa]|uniref:chaperone protein ClpC, chloroplastic-like n=1 Tax=Populus trichocarpa TaxID=3694 RepID=UPI00227946E0|nr:chaperone protein ClpC, chloroplastic-like [Populus trichocarpa]
MARLVAGTKFHGDFEERLTGIVDEVKQSDGNIVLFIDELHTLVGNGQTLDATNILKPALARGELKCIGATTIDEYRRYIEKDGALKRRFLHVDVPEPSVDEAVEILKGIQRKYEAHHDVKYADEALVAAVRLSNQYIRSKFTFTYLVTYQIISDSILCFQLIPFILNTQQHMYFYICFSGLFLPDKAIDLIDEAGARVQLRQARSASEKLLVTEEDIQAVVSMVTGIPLDKVTDKESRRLLNMEAELHKYIVGQEEAVKAVSHAIRRARVGTKDPNKPIASFLFTGPTGVGKTELAKALAVEYFGSKEAVVRIDMSEYMEKHTVSKLFGSPPGYIGYDDGGQFTEAVRCRAHTVVLFDEIEKAHQDVNRVFLQILDDGTLTDGKGRKVDFKNTIIIMTSNIGNSLIAQEDEEDEIRFNTVKLIVAEELKKEFSPEFLNRIDEVIVFRKLNNAQLNEIADLMLAEVYGRLKAKNIIIRVTDGLKRKIIEEGNNLSYGARPLKRAIVRLLEDNIAKGILNGFVEEGRSVIVDVNSNGNVIMLHSDVAVETEDYEHSMI